jgi:hypothetical protein
LGGLMNDFSGCLARANYLAVTETFFGKTDEVTVLKMPTIIRISGL